MSQRFLLSTAAISLALLASPAHAYLDPASGSMFLQLLVGGIAGLALAIKLYWRKLLGFFGSKQEQDDGPPG